MAKKIITGEAGVEMPEQQVPGAIPDTTQVVPEGMVAAAPPEVSDASAPQEPIQVPAQKAEQKPETARNAPVLPDHIDRILRANSTYPELYIDPHGGTFTVSTPAALRTGATLHVNPYHKPS